MIIAFYKCYISFIILKKRTGIIIFSGTSRSPTYNPKTLVEEGVGEKKTATNISHVLYSAKKTLQFNYASVLLITVAGTSISVLLLVAIGFQFRSKGVCIKVENDNGKEYSEIRNI